MCLQLDVDLDTGRQLQIHQSLDRLLGRVHDVDQALVGAALKLLAAVLILMNSAQDGDDLGLRRQRNGAGDLRVGTLCGFDDLLRRLVDQLVILGLEADTDHFLVACGCHVVSSVTNFFGGIGSAWFARMRSPYTVPCVSNPARKTNRLSPVCSRAGDIRKCWLTQPPDHLPCKGAAADILHGSYRRRAPQSPASSQNAPVSAQALHKNSKNPPECQEGFSLKRRNFAKKFVQSAKITPPAVRAAPGPPPPRCARRPRAHRPAGAGPPPRSGASARRA